MTARAVANASGEKYPESGMSQSSSLMRPWADKSSFGIDGNGILSNRSVRRRGADPPKNESGRTRAPFVQTYRCVSSGNGFCIASVNLSQRELVVLIQISQMRLECSDSSAATVLSHSWSDWPMIDISDTGRTGQVSSTSDMGRCPR